MKPYHCNYAPATEDGSCHFSLDVTYPILSWRCSCAIKACLLCRLWCHKEKKYNVMDGKQKNVTSDWTTVFLLSFFSRLYICLLTHSTFLPLCFILIHVTFTLLVCFWFDSSACLDLQILLNAIWQPLPLISHPVSSERCSWPTKKTWI